MTAQPLAINITPGDHIKWHVFGGTLNADTLLGTAVAGAIVIGLGLMLRRSASSTSPSKVQLVWEMLTTWIQDQVEDTIGLKTAPFVVPLAITLFAFILIANWLSVIPTGHHPEYMPPPASDVNFTYALAITVILWMHIAGVRKKGVRGYYHHLFQPYWFMFPINLVEEIARPVTLALRLFGNLFSGVIMVALLASLPSWLGWLPEIPWKLFEMLIGLIQAFIFALLTMLYFSSVRPAEEGAH